ncbi:unnamed protein product [Acanthoscelides obtectus]|uniref:Uncharacterized protein n=1 Tax=Acanthoscelides obtectus TaxID=200917 RepID=A0A9P0MG15_ACAOB|nr:unnamed protein product [Acanthoscelides obtectus]CAK1683886.1 hypothetical protein AOBTE_LOCUS34504 [Acanthoscelides obtectus]
MQEKKNLQISVALSVMISPSFGTDFDGSSASLTNLTSVPPCTSSPETLSSTSIPHSDNEIPSLSLRNSSIWV